MRSPDDWHTVRFVGKRVRGTNRPLGQRDMEHGLFRDAVAYLEAEGVREIECQAITREGFTTLPVRSSPA